MFLEIKKEINHYFRTTKSGRKHIYKRKKTIVVLRCDNCDSVFNRDLKSMDRKRMNNNYFHCCSSCDMKRFAQKKGVERKKMWDLPADLDWPISKF